jgi:phosphatidylglycerophosphatase A
MAVLAVIGGVVCVKCAPAAITVTGKADPGEVVADEFAGMAVTFAIAAAAAAGQIWITAVLGFVVFRVFDIAKPWPIRRLEKLPQGWGILCDDLLAGVYAGIVLLICAKLGVTEMFAGSGA